MSFAVDVLNRLADGCEKKGNLLFTGHQVAYLVRAARDHIVTVDEAVTDLTKKALATPEAQEIIRYAKECMDKRTKK